MAKIFLTPAQERGITGVLAQAREDRVDIRGLEAMGFPDEELAARNEQIIRSCQGALEYNEQTKMGDVE